MQWTEEDPAAGDMSELEHVAQYLEAAARDAEGLGTDLKATDATLTPDLWSGPAREAFSDALMAKATALPTLGEQYSQAATAIRSYIRTVVEDIRPSCDRARLAAQEVGEAADRAPWLFRMYSGSPYAWSATWETQRSSTPDEPLDMLPITFHNSSGLKPSAYGVTHADAEKWAAYVSAEVAFHARIVHEFTVDREAADNRLKSALNDLMPSWTESRSAYRAVGITDPAQMTPVHLAEVLAADPGRDGDALTYFLETYGTDPWIMSIFYQGLGGQGTAYFFTQVGTWTDGRVTGPGARSSLAGATNLWDQEAAVMFVEGVFDAYEGDPAVREWVAVIFAGPPWMGQHVAVAAANEVDEMERLEHQLLGWSGPGAHFGDPPVGVDVSGLVLQNLAAHPEAARDWLTLGNPGTGAGSQRSAYWFGRDWTQFTDNFTSPAALLAATQDPTLRGLDPTTGAMLDPAATADAARVFAEATRTLGGNDTFTTGHVSASASAAIGEAIKHNYAAMVEGQTDPRSKAVQDEPDPTFSGAIPLRDGIDVTLPAVKAEDRDHLFAIASLSEDGRAAINDGVNAYSLELLRRVEESGVEPPAAARLVAEKLSTAYALAGFGADAATMSVAQYHDAQVQAGIDAGVWGASALAGGWAMPGIGASVLYSGGIGAVGSLAGDSLGDWLADDTTNAAGQVNLDIDARSVTTQRAILEATAKAGRVDTGLDTNLLSDAALAAQIDTAYNNLYDGDPTWHVNEPITNARTLVEQVQAAREGTS